MSYVYMSLMACMWTSHVTFINESGHISGWIMSRKRIGEFAYTNESWLIWKYKHASCHIHKWDIPQIWMSHVTFMDESWQEREMPHIWLRHVSDFTNVNESCHMHPRVTPHIWMSHVTHMNGSCHTYEWVMSRKMNVTHMTALCHSCHIREWVMSHLNGQETRCDLARPWEDWVMAHILWKSYVTRMSESWHTYGWVMSRKWVSHVTHMNESRHMY